MTDEQAYLERRLSEKVAQIISDPLFSPEFGGMFSCWEAEVMAQFLFTFRDRDAAQRLMESHAASDDDEGDEHGDGFDLDGILAEE